jgi:hypothetical protein
LWVVCMLMVRNYAIWLISFFEFSRPILLFRRFCDIVSRLAG